MRLRPPAPGLTPDGGRLRVTHVSVVHAWDDPRIAERECRSLAAAGHDVTLLVPGDVPPDPWHGVRVIALPRRSRTTRWLTSREILTELHHLQPHVVHVHDPELLTLLPLLRPFTPRLVYDMHEYVSDAVSTKHYIPSPLRPAAAGVTAAAQRALAAVADGVVAVVREQFDDLGERPLLRAAVPNYPRLERFDGAAALPDMAADPRLKLIYIGSLTRNRGVPVMLEVIREIGDQAVLFLGGRFSNPEFEAEVRELAGDELAHCLRLLGPVAPPDVPRQTGQLRRGLGAGAGHRAVPAPDRAEQALRRHGRGPRGAGLGPARQVRGGPPRGVRPGCGTGPRRPSGRHAPAARRPRCGRRDGRPRAPGRRGPLLLAGGRGGSVTLLPPSGSRS